MKVYWYQQNGMLNNLKVLQGFIDIAGQASRYSMALRQQGVYSEAWLYSRPLKTGTYDRMLDFSNSGIWSGRFRKFNYLIQAYSNFNIFHIHKGFSAFQKARDLELARMLGKKVYIHYRGSEIRKDMQAKGLTKKVIDKITRESKVANKVLVKDGQLAELIKPYVNEVEVFPNIVDLSSVPSFERQYNYEEKLRIVHIPSNPSVKGTDTIRSAMKKLGSLVKYEEFTSLTHGEVLQKYLNSDLVVDQILTGTYGNASLEAMGLGATVLNYLNPKFLAYELDQPPIMNIDPLNICDVIVYIDKNREILERHGALGMSFVERNHSFTSVGKKLHDLYIQSY